MAFPATFDPQYTITASTYQDDATGLDALTIINGLSQANRNSQIVIGLSTLVDNTSILYKLSGIPATDKAASLTGTEIFTNKSLTLPTIGSGGATFNGGSGSTILKASSTASGTLTLPAATDTLVGKATTDTMSNKTISTGSALDANANANFTYLGLARQAIINGGCVVAQRVTAPSATTSYQYGAIDRIAGKATGSAVNAGTVAQSTSANAGSTTYSFKMSGMTVTGTGIIYARYRMESRDAVNFKNGVASFSCSIYQDTGGAINYTIFIRKATVADNFSSVTDIANSGAISVSNTTKTTITFNNINSGNIGDVTNGIEIEIQAACGAVTTKNFEFADWQFNKGSFALSFQAKCFTEELKNCERYCEKSYDYTVAPGAGTSVNGRQYALAQGSANLYQPSYSYKTRKRAAPTLTIYSYNDGATGNVYDNTATANKTVSPNTGESSFEMLTFGAGISANDLILWHWLATAEL